MASRGSCLAFNVEWFDANASLVRKYRLNYYEDETLDMINSVTGKSFLKRTYCPGVQKSDLFIGASITVFSRQLHLIEYADEGTTAYFSAENVRPFALVKPSAFSSIGEIISSIQHPFSLARMKMISLDASAADRFGCSAGQAVAIETTVIAAGANDDVASRWAKAMEVHGDGVYTACGGQDSHDDTVFAFETCRSSLESMPASSDMTACLVKPHVVIARQAGSVLSEILASGFTITAMEMVHLDRSMATNFFTVYQGVLTEYADMVAHMIENYSIFIRLEGPNVVADFRDFCGPNETELAKVLRPKSLRAQFGETRVRNAVHCTDLPEDGGLECEYFQYLLGV